MTPRVFASRIEQEGKARGLTVKVLDKKAIEKERMGGLLAVNRGSAEEPRFVALEHRGGKKDDPFVALVGKGVTFDSGGISIKPSEKMGEMKWDMMGAATAVGVVLAAADLKLPVNLVALTPLTENLPSGTAYKPGDIVRFRNGKTAEIDNTDAEGRVILADALDYAKEWKPAVILDYATLTGAALVALGLEAADRLHGARRPLARAWCGPASGPTSGSGGCRSGRTTRRTSSPTGPTSRTRAGGGGARSTARCS